MEIVTVTRLDELLDSISPQRTSETTARRVDAAINRFVPGPGPVHTHEAFERELFRFCRLVEATVLNVRGGPVGADPEMDRGRFLPVITQAYGHQGFRAAFEIARTGNEGGFYAVLRRVGQAFAEQYTENEISARIGTFWSGLSVAEQLASADEYLAKYGQLLPAELTEGSAGRIRANLPKVLQEHTRILQRLHRVGR